MCEAILQVWGASVQQSQPQEMTALLVLTRAACEALAR